MVNSMMRQNLVFVAGWILAGLAIAFVVNQLWSGHGATVVQGPSPIATGIASQPMVLTPDPAVLAPTVVSTLAGDARGNGSAPVDPAPATSSYAPAVKISAPAVVSIYTLSKVNPGDVVQTSQGLRRARSAGVQEGLGSGVIVDAHGHIITNNHVIDGADQVAVQLADGRSAPIIVVGTDPATDLALLKIDLPRLPVMTLGRSDLLEVGDVVLAIGNSIGLTQTVTQGIVSAKGRSLLGAIASFEDFIQTDAAINHGNSGGALVNAHGELVGINTAVVGQAEGAEGLGLAIPVDLMRGVMQDILKHGRVVRGWIGIKAEFIADGDPRARNLPYTGLIVTGLAANSTARAPGGLEIGDKLETIDSQPVRTTQDVGSRIASHKPGSTVKFSGTRQNGQPYSAEVQVIDDPAAQ